MALDTPLSPRPAGPRRDSGLHGNWCRRLAYGLGGAFAYGFMQTVASYQVQLSVEKSP
ncbi:hypothetical protein CSC36_6091 [Pseudomonas aeruginosa]|nr:hypothetical protein CSC36_6091 [Pseudomonas aeruginosa]